MESVKVGKTLVSFLQEMLHNKFLLLAVALAVFAATYFCIGLTMLLSR